MEGKQLITNKTIVKAEEYLRKRGIMVIDGSGEQNVEACFIALKTYNKQLIPMPIPKH